MTFYLQIAASNGCFSIEHLILIYTVSFTICMNFVQESLCYHEIRSPLVNIVFVGFFFFCSYGVYCPTIELFTHIETSSLPVKGSKFWPMLSTRGHWAASVPHLLWHGESAHNTYNPLNALTDCATAVLWSKNNSKNLFFECLLHI